MSYTYIPEHKALDMYDDMLDECEGDVCVAGLTFSASRIIKELDETAYRCGFNDWCDANDITTDEDEADEEDEEDEEEA